MLILMDDRMQEKNDESMWKGDRQRQTDRRADKQANQQREMYDHISR